MGTGKYGNKGQSQMTNREIRAIGIGIVAIILIGIMVVWATWDRKTLAAQSVPRAATIEVKSVPGIDNLRLVVYNGILVCPVKVAHGMTNGALTETVVCTKL